MTLRGGSRRRSAAGLVALVLVGAALALIMQPPDRRGLEIDDLTGTAWFPSTELGAAVLIDGTTGRVVTRVAEVATKDVAFDVQQLGASTMVSEPRVDRVRRVDGRTWEPSEPVPTHLPGQRLAARGRHAWVYSPDGTPGRLQALDPAAPDLAGPPIDFDAPIVQVELTDDGTAWLIDDTGQVWSARAGARAGADGAEAGDPVRAERAGADRQPGAHLLVVDDRPVTLATDGTGQVLDPATGHAVERFDLPFRPDLAATAGSRGDRAWVMGVDARGQLRVVDAHTGEHQPPLLLGDGRYGPPVEHDGLVYVPDLAGSAIAVADPGRGQVTTVRLEEGGRAAFGDELVLFVHDDKVWFDEPAGDHAGVFTDRHTPEVVSKAHDEPIETTTSTTATTDPDRPRTTTTSPLDPGEEPRTTTSSPDTPVTSVPRPIGPPPAGPGPGPTSTVPTPGPQPTSTTTAPPAPPCGERPAMIDAPGDVTGSPDALTSFTVDVMVCQPAPAGYQDWVMSQLLAHGTEPATWWAKARIGRECTEPAPSVWFSCTVTLSSTTTPDLTRHFVVVRFPDAVGNTWVQTLYENDANDPQNNLTLPEHQEISNRSANVLHHNPHDPTPEAHQARPGLHAFDRGVIAPPLLIAVPSTQAAMAGSSAPSMGESGGTRPSRPRAADRDAPRSARLHRPSATTTGLRPPSATQP